MYNKGDGTFEKKYELPTPTDLIDVFKYWIITEDGIKYRIGTTKADLDCASKLDIVKAKRNAGSATCLWIAVSVDGSLEKTKGCAQDADLDNLNCNDTPFFVSKEGITAGHPDCVIAGRIISGTNPRPAECDSE